MTNNEITVFNPKVEKEISNDIYLALKSIKAMVNDLKGRLPSDMHNQAYNANSHIDYAMNYIASVQVKCRNLVQS